MDYESAFIMPTLLIYYNKGHTELETYQDISLKYGPLTITLKTTRRWFAKFRANNHRSTACKITRQPKFTDDFLINLVNQNPSLNMKELGELCDTSSKTISNRLKQINGSFKRANYVKKHCLSDALKDHTQVRMFNDEYLIKLVDENPELSMKKLGKLAGCSATTIARRMDQINAGGDKVGYRKKDLLNYKTKFTDEYLINLINDNPTLNLKQLANLTNSSPKTISDRIKQINSIECRINYTKKATNQSKLSDEDLITAVNNNPGLTMNELAKLANYSISTISARIRKINSIEHRISYTYKSSKSSKSPKSKLTDEALIAAVNNNPSLNTRELGELIGVSQRTVCRRLNQINKDGDVVIYEKKKRNTTDIGLSDEELIELILNNSKLSIIELANIINCTKSKLAAKIKQLNDKEAVHISKKPVKNSKYRLSDEELINLKDSNPGLSVRELAKIAGYSANTVYRRLKEINSVGEERLADQASVEL